MPKEITNDKKILARKVAEVIEQLEAEGINPESFFVLGRYLTAEMP